MCAEYATDDLFRFIDAADIDFTVTSAADAAAADTTTTTTTTTTTATTDSASRVEEEEEEEEEGEIPPSNPATSPVTTAPSVVDIWPSIARALDDWTQRIVDTELRHRSRRATFRQRVGDALHRMKGDGLLNSYDIDEIQYVADLWSHLLSAASCYSVGDVFAKRDIITYLLELYSLHQISRELVVEACLQL